PGGKITALTSWGNGIALLIESVQGSQEIWGIDSQGVVKRRLRVQPGSDGGVKTPNPR
ncbi:MAG: hypothetical protein HQL63_09985, partial [Magnetococcales bacterium]|nr:hypothetical protein [Magnetococcales bacterium]